MQEVPEVIGMGRFHFSAAIAASTALDGLSPKRNREER
jgi:hypothetical protein